MRFSVVIPTYNRPEPLRRCLEGFTRLDHPSWELLVVNDGGETSFGAIDGALRARLPLTTIDAPHGGPAAARNAGARAARGEFLAFTDDDCIPEPDWLRQLERGFVQENAAVLGGAAINPFPDSTAAVTWELYLDFLREYFQDASGNGLMLPSNNLAYRREAFWSLGGFDETFPLAAAEDVDLAYRAVGAGLRQRYFDDARVWHHHRSTPRGYLRQQFRYGRGSFDLRRRAYAVQAVPRRPGEFYWQLARFLRRRRAPLGVWALVWMTPFAHRAGIVSQSLRYRSTVADS
ncbi:MAG: glycosyltransferase [Acidobacteria bacterium]|jgi:cellulose synthase/poly-beta-1,6-N-acetylglucosamine synthase-like glycosyltransferase|nr:glycosyltransferase [Acidobacteriota bacterium]